MAKGKPRVLATRHFPPDVEARLATNFDAVLNPQDKLYDGTRLAEASRGCDAIMCAAGDPLNTETIGKLADTVKMIATFSVGYEHVDVAAAAKRGIRVSNTPDVLTDATADITLLCLLGAARRAHEGTTMLRTHSWVGWEPTQLMGVHVTGKRLGILGMGRIGEAIAKRAEAFGMKIRYHNRSKKALAYAYDASPVELARHSDCLMVATPGGAETAKIINAAVLDALGPRGYLVNISRGSTVDEPVLLRYLQEKRIAGAGLDVFLAEPNVNPAFFALPNAVIYPHVGSASHETRFAMGMLQVNNLRAHFGGKPVLTRVV